MKTYLNTLLLLSAVLLCAVMSCTKSTPSHEPQAEEEHGDEHDHENGHDDEHEHSGSDDHLIRIEPSMMRDLRITTTVVRERPSGETVTALGELRVNEDAYSEIGSPIQARVVRLLATPGDHVKSDQGLVELESAAIGQMRGTLISARARAELARQTVERKRALARDRIVSERELQVAEADAAQANADLLAAQTSLSAVHGLRGQGSRFVLSSPLAGTVIDRNAISGQLIDAETTLFKVGDLKLLWLIAKTFERDALRIRAGTVAQVTFAALPGKNFSGTVTRIGSHVDPTSRTVDVRIEIENKAETLRPGMSATTLLPLGSSDETVVAVPGASLQRLEDGWSVFIPRDAETFEIREVGRGRDLGGEVEIVSGLKPGETVVVEGAFLLKAEGDKASSAGAHHAH